MATDKSSNQVKEWLARLNIALRHGDVASVVKLFGRECYWRDLVSLTWNIFTAEGHAEIQRMLVATLPHSLPHDFRIDGAAEVSNGIVEAWFTFETSTGRGRGHLRLKDGQGFTILTTLSALKGHEEHQGRTREKGITHG